jgi:uncharacterized protein YciI
MKSSVLFFVFLLWLSFSAFAQASNTQFEMKEGDTTYVMKQYILCFLKQGANRSQSKEEVEKIQNEHLAHLNLLATQGKISIAGPFGDDGALRGIVIYNVNTVEEARQLAENDPAVQAGRLVLEFHPWWAAKGSVLK